MWQMRKRRQRPKPVTLRDQFSVEVGDDVLVRNKESNKLWVAHILRMTKIKGRISVEVRWYYRMEEILSKAPSFIGDKEFIISDHYGFVDGETISEKCRVHTFSAYQGISSDKLEENDYYWRFEYSPVLHKFKEVSVPVYWECQLPENPDKMMVMCSNCDKWYHRECVNLQESDPDKLSEMDFCCPTCTSLLNI
ncbi:chromatin remodeling protein EBS-like [Rosa rugosa]|uniref:chromatin remodeling protein EBS-like n=1 Tax=Rosa rugosa TaxID=74645 RepID=UPI002B414F67|nr:chromatin remodeling protein EBS-like [Rosa rugosa]